MAAKRRKKKLLLSATALVLTAAVGAGIWFGTRGGGEPVNVYPFQYVGMTEFWGDAQESYGPVTTDKIQTEFLSDTQTVTEVAVKDGDMVKKGDVLFSFDTTLDALTLERKRLEVEKVKVQIKAAEERLAEVRQLEPYIPAESKPEKEDLGKQLKDQRYKISENPVYNGSKKETALICWLKDDTAVSDTILKELYETSVAYQKEKPAGGETAKPETEDKAESSASEVPGALLDLQEPTVQSDGEKKYKVKGFFTCNGETVEPDDITVGKDGYLIKNSYTYQGKTYWLESATPVNPSAMLKNLKIDPYPQAGGEEQVAWEALWEAGIDVKYMRDVSVTGKQLQDNTFDPIEKDDLIQLEVGQNAVLMFQSQMTNPPIGTEVEFIVTPSDGILSVAYKEGYVILSGKPEKVTNQTIPYTVTARYNFYDNHSVNREVEESFFFSVSVVSQTPKGEFYAVFKVTEDNYQLGTLTTWRGYKVIAYEDGNFDLLPYDAVGFDDHTLPEKVEVEINLPDILPGEMYTAEQLLDMQKQLHTTIKEQTEKLRLVESEYAIMERELGDGKVYAEIDGKVVSLLTEEEARESQQPVVKVSGGGGFYIEGSISELEKASLKIGQEVTVNDWNTGNVYTGEVVSISDFPSEQDNWNGMGNPTAAYYPFKAFVSEEADLEAGSYVSMTYSASAAEHGIYLEKAFVRTEKGESYIYVRGAGGKLEKRTVRVGKVLWGSYYEILSDLSEEDYLAFPYGKNVKHGAPTVESDISALYSY